MDPSSLLIWEMLFGAIGFGYFLYGRKQRKIVPLVTGVCLFVFPYMVSDIYLIIVGFILIIIPYFVRY